MSDKNNYQNLKEYNAQNYDAFIKIIHEIIENTPIREFSYQRFYLGGAHLSLFSHFKFSLYYFDERNDLGEIFYETIKNLKDNQYYFFIWPSPDINDIVFTNIYRFNIWGGLSIYKRIKDYVDTFHFSGEPGVDMTNFYMNNKKFLLSIIQYFLNKGNHLINVNDRSILGLHTGPFILDKFNEPISAKQSLLFNINGKQVSIAPQELKCLTLLAKGFTTKWIAKELNLSPRTVESHLNSIKFKCNLWGKDYMVNFFHKEIEHELQQTYEIS